MPEGQVLELSRISKHFGAVQAVHDVSARIEPGTVTGFLGPNGAGKTTTLRMLLGLVQPTAGTATIGGVPYAKLDDPVRTVGAVLEASSFHPGRSAANHLKVFAQAASLPTSRIDDVLGLVGLSDVAGRKVGGFSLGMRQRLGLATALLGDPGVLVLDEPANGLDPEGITWMRRLLQALAAEGRTVLMSSHLLAEVAQTVDRLLIIAAGRLVFTGALEDLADRTEYATVVDSPDRVALETVLTQAGIAYDVRRAGLTARGREPEDIGALVASHGIALSTLQRRGPSLEDVFFQLVDGTRRQDAAPEPEAGASGPVAEQAEQTVSPVPERAQRDEGAPAEPAAAARPVAGASSRPSGSLSDRADTSGSLSDRADTSGSLSDRADLPGALAVRPPQPSTRRERATPPPVDHGGHAGFAVASTGIIDIIPSSRDADAEVVAGEPAVLPDDDTVDAPTDADRDADAFFRSFDGAASAADDTSAPTSSADEKGRA